MVSCVAEELLRKKIRDPSDFEWLKQCRFYWREEQNTVIISICDCDLEYSFEYLGTAVIKLTFFSTAVPFTIIYMSCCPCPVPVPAI